MKIKELLPLKVPIPLKLIFICFIFFSLAVNLGRAVQLTRDSYMYYIDTGYETSNKTYTKLSVSFKTTELNGLLIWNGQVFTLLILLRAWGVAFCERRCGGWRGGALHVFIA